MRGTLADLDERDQAILIARVTALPTGSPRVGDFVTYDDGTVRRISYVWDWDGADEALYQTSDGGSYYLGDGYVSMSGSLHTSTPRSTLVATDEVRDGSVWFFHHDYHTAHNGVDTLAAFPVWHCTTEPTA
jgi:hypothetical protein